LARLELTRAVEGALARFATSGLVRLDGDTLELTVPQGSVSQDARKEIIHWESQAPAQRERTANHLARRLAQSVPPSIAPPPKRRWPGDAATWTLAVAACLISAAVIYLSQFQARPGVTPPTSTVVTSAAALEPVVSPSQGVCHATRSRIFRGGLVSLVDAEGWVVELSLIGKNGDKDFLTHPALQEFVGPVRRHLADYRYQGEPHLALTPGAQPQVEVRSFSVAGAGQARPGLTLSFRGSFVESYFDELNRSKFYHLAHSITAQLAPEFAGLYARCEGDKLHTLGSWFLGKDGPAAAASLLYFLGIHAQPRHIAALHYRSAGGKTVDHGLALASIIQGTTHLDRAALSTLVGSEGGMALGSESVVISFPFRDGNRAARVSRTIARVTSLSE